MSHIIRCTKSLLLSLQNKQTKKQKSKEKDIPGEVEFVLLPEVSSWLAPDSSESLSRWVLCWGGGSLIAFSL